MYDLDIPEIIGLFEKKSKDIDVKLILDDHNYIENLSFAKHDNRSALMHNKFCIVDSKKVFTGSMNPTENGVYKNNNNMILIESEQAAKIFQEEFEEMWEGEFSRGNSTHSDFILFCPEDNCADKVKQLIRGANQSIYFTAFSFTHDAIATELLLKHYQGVDIRGVFEKTRISKYSRYHILKHHGVNVRMDKNKYVMHHKFWIIDNSTVITGSFNPSYSADTRNDENIVILQTVYEDFLEEFRKI